MSEIRPQNTDSQGQPQRSLYDSLCGLAGSGRFSYFGTFRTPRPAPKIAQYDPDQQQRQAESLARSLAFDGVSVALCPAFVFVNSRRPQCSHYHALLSREPSDAWCEAHRARHGRRSVDVRPIRSPQGGLRCSWYIAAQSTGITAAAPRRGGRIFVQTMPAHPLALVAALALPAPEPEPPEPQTPTNNKSAVPREITARMLPARPRAPPRQHWATQEQPPHGIAFGERRGNKTAHSRPYYAAKCYIHGRQRRRPHIDILPKGYAMNKQDTPTPAELAQARAEFVALCTEYPYNKAVAVMGETHARGRPLLIWQALQCSNKIPPPAGVAAGRHVADPKAKPNLYQNLHDNAAG